LFSIFYNIIHFQRKPTIEAHIFIINNQIVVKFEFYFTISQKIWKKKNPAGNEIKKIPPYQSRMPAERLSDYHSFEINDEVYLRN